MMSFLAVALLSATADAHLMPMGKGTINVIGKSAYIVLSLPVSAFAAVPSCADGVLTKAELAADHEALRRAVLDGLMVEADGVAKLDRVLFDLPVGYGHAPDQSGELTVMVVARLPAESPPKLSWRLWSEHAPSLTIRATASDGGNTLKSEVATISRGQPSHRFFTK